MDGNNLAYRAFFALPEELQTTDGQPTNALLGFTNMLFKLLSDYKPRGVAVAWDTRPVHRKEIDAEYKGDRRPMPDLLREQFPHFRPIVEAFGYQNLEFEGWEADDVIATLATQADEAGVKTCVVSTDRDAFQLVSENVCLMMTPRGVADVQVYTPERVEARYGIQPSQIPDFIGLKGDTSDNIPGIPGIGDKTAGQLVAQYGSLEEVVGHAGELSPARSKAIAENAEQAVASKLLATMRRDLDLGVDPATLVPQPPDRSELKEIFRRFEFRGLLSRVDTLDEALPAAERPRPRPRPSPWREGDLTGRSGRVGVAADADRIAVATEAGEVIVAPSPSDTVSRRLRSLAVVAHDAKPLRLGEPVAGRHDAARVPDRSRPRRVRPRRPHGRVRRRARAGSARRGGDGALVRHAEAARRLAAPLREGRGAGLGAALPRRRAAAQRRPRRDGGRRRPHRHVPHGGDHGAPLGPHRGARVARVRAGGRGVRPRVAAAARPDPLREAGAHAGPEGEDRLLHRLQGALARSAPITRSSR